MLSRRTTSYSLGLVLLLLVAQAFASHTGLFVNEPVVHWQFESAGPIYGDSSTDEESVYFANTSGEVFALDKLSGEQKWHYQVDAAVYSNVNLSANAVYFQAEDGYSYKLDKDNGSLLWRTQTSSVLERSPIFFSGSDWDYKASSPIEYEGVVYVGGTDNRAYALNADTGAEIWQYATDGIVRTDLAVFENRLVFGTFGGDIHCLDPVTGDVQWVYDTAPTTPEGGLTYINSTPAWLNGVIYVGSRNTHVYALDLASGEELWVLPWSGSWVETRASIYDGILYLGSSFLRSQFAIDAVTSEQLWQNSRMKSLTYADLAVNEESVYVGTISVPGLFFDGFLPDGGLAKLNRDDGTLVWEWEQEAGDFLNEFGIVSAPVLEQNRLYFGDLNGIFTLLEDAVVEYPIIQFSLDRSELKPREKTQLRWEVAKGHKVRLNGKRVPRKGVRTIRGRYDKEFTLEVNGRLQQTETLSLLVKPQEDINLARFASASASSVEEAFETDAAFAIDGDLSTRWASAHQDGEYLLVDLGDVYDVDRIKIFWEFAHASQYRIEASNDMETWEVIHQEAENTGGENDITGLDTEARYLKLIGEVRATQWGVSLYEIEVYEGEAKRRPRRCRYR